MQTYQRMTVKNIINFANPKSFVASVIPAIFGILLSLKFGYSISLIRALALIFACVFFQASVNTINDYSDFVNGVDSIDDNLKEDDNVMFYNHIRPKSVDNLGWIFLGLGICLGLLALDGINYASIVIGIIATLTVLFYSKGPFPISYFPIGELTSGLVMGGLIPLGVNATISGRLNPEILAHSLPFILGIALIMMSNNASDIEKDKRAKRYTLAVVMGREKIRILYKITVGLWIVSQLVLTYYLLGYLFLGINLILFMIKGKFLKNLIFASLLPEARIGQMMSIGMANVLINGTYLLCLALSFIGS